MLFLFYRNATLFTLKLKEDPTEVINLETSESDIAVIVNQMAVDYNMMPGNVNNNNNDNNGEYCYFLSYFYHSFYYSCSSTSIR